MSAIVNILRSFWRLFIWWVVIEPWELAIRVRLGRHRTRLSPGLSFRIPYIDHVYKQSVRLRFTTLPPQTVTSEDGHTLTMAGFLGYTIIDVDRLYDTLQQADGALSAVAQNEIAHFVQEHPLAECSPHDIEREASRGMALDKYGIGFDSLRLTTFARVKTHRLIMDSHIGVWDDLLNTRTHDMPATNGAPS